MSIVSQEPMSRGRSRSRSAERSSRRIRRRKAPGAMSRSMVAPSEYTFLRTASINQGVSTAGFVWNVGVVPSGNFSIWFTNQNAYIWASATNYSTVAVPGYSDLAGLFDEVKIEAVEITVNCANDANTFGGNGSAVICMATDYNDKNAPAGTSDVQQYADCRTYNLTVNRPLKMTVTPKFLTYTLESSGGSIASTPKTGYVRSNLDIEHCCLKGSFMLAPPSTGQYVFTFRYKYKCRIAK